MPWIESERGFRLNYTDAGVGFPVLFVHGWCMSSGVWKFQQEGLSSDLRIISIDLGGHGYSGIPESRLAGFAGYAANIEELVTFLELERFVAVGWSMGAQALIASYPAVSQRLAGMVLVGATPRFTASHDFPYALPDAEAKGMCIKVRRSLERALHGFKRNILSELETDSDSASTLASFLETLPVPSQEAAIEGLDALMEEDVFGILPMIQKKVLIIHGSCDKICLATASEFLERAICQSKRICYEGAGHAPFLTTPERFNKDILKFVRLVSDAD